MKRTTTGAQERPRRPTGQEENTMGLFDKKICGACGEKIRFLGSKKLEDGNLCGKCEGKLSPWFTDRRKTTLEDIRRQLQDRELNRARVSAFRADRTLGEYNRLLIDSEKGQFLVLMNGKDLADNPDVMDLSRVQDAQVEVERSRTEETTKDENGKLVSYDPPRFTYSYRFFLVIRVDHPWFDEMKFRINADPVKIRTGQPIELPGLLSAFIPQQYTPDEPDIEHSADYQAAKELGESMRLALLRQDQPEPRPAPEKKEETPEEPFIIRRIACPACSAVSLPDENGRCPYCGEKLT